MTWLSPASPVAQPWWQSTPRLTSRPSGPLPATASTAASATSLPLTRRLPRRPIPLARCSSTTPAGKSIELPTRADYGLTLGTLRFPAAGALRARQHRLPQEIPRSLGRIHREVRIRWLFERRIQCDRPDHQNNRDDDGRQKFDAQKKWPDVNFLGPARLERPGL